MSRSIHALGMMAMAAAISRGTPNPEQPVMRRVSGKPHDDRPQPKKHKTLKRGKGRL